MNELVKIRTSKSGRKVVSARELYEKLGYNKAVWARWYQKNIIENEFAIENEDWVGFNIMLNGNSSQDFALSIDFAKRLSMMARTETGESIRRYFIECEKALMMPSYQIEDPIVRARAWIEEQRDKQRVESLLIEASHKIEADKPKVVFAESVTGSQNSILIRKFAKDLCDGGFEIGQNRLFEWFRANGYLNKENEPYQEYIARGLFEVITRSIGSGEETFTTKTSKLTGKGQVYFAEKIKNSYKNEKSEKK